MIEFKDFSFQYEEGKEDSLKHVNLTIPDGTFLLLTGRSGCGKTTMIRSLNGLIPHFYPGTMTGELLQNGVSLVEMPPSEMAGKIGTVFQDPRSQFFMTDTTRELAFGCENMGYSREEIIRRMVKTAQDLELGEYLNRNIFALSSGEKQQIAIGSVYAMTPDVYIFDEPSANLDYEATRRLTKVMKFLKNAGKTVVVVEHRFYYLRELIDQVAWMEQGELVRTFTREEFWNLEEETRIRYGMRTLFPERELRKYQSPSQAEGTHTPVLTVSGLGYAYEKRTPIFSDVSFTAGEGEIIGIIGHNGAGKTTLLSVLTGLLKEKTGEIRFRGNRLSPRKRRKLSYLVMQDADYQLFASSVEEELTLGLTPAEAGGEKVLRTLDELNLKEYRERHPASLSGGQKQRVTIGAALMKNSQMLYFDEPTSGLDYDSMVRVSGLIRVLAEKGGVIFVISHDFEFLARTCTKILKLDRHQRTYHLYRTEEVIDELIDELTEK
ncbi:MAG: ABC transporter ATP-binding protein [Lachnospiraceae bacterium]|nr:ABC transporter ATP-binding protein [Lachnospiraceae bacterium]